MNTIDPILFDDEAAIGWGTRLSIPRGYAKSLVSRFKVVAERTRTREEWANWCQAEKRALHSYPLYEAKKAKVAYWLNEGQGTRFGHALRMSYFRHSFDVWRTIAEHSHWDSATDRR
jgi:hypothetical protein